MFMLPVISLLIVVVIYQASLRNNSPHQLSCFTFVVGSYRELSWCGLDQFSPVKGVVDAAARLRLLSSSCWTHTSLQQLSW